MIKSDNTNDICDTALEHFMRNVLHVQDHSRLSLVADNAKSPTHSPTRKPRKETKKKAILQFTVAQEEPHVHWSTSPTTVVNHHDQWPTSPAPINNDNKKSSKLLGMDRWGDLHYEPQQRQLRNEQKKDTQTKHKDDDDSNMNNNNNNKNNNEDKKVASNQRFQNSLNESNDRPLPSSVIGGHVAMLRQNSLERHFLAVASKDEHPSSSSLLATVPEDESLNGEDHHDSVVGVGPATSSPSSPKMKRKKKFRTSTTRRDHHHEEEHSGKSCCQEEGHVAAAAAKPWKVDLLERETKNESDNNKKDKQKQVRNE